MADAYVVMIDLFPAAMFFAIRAALIPSSPRRTVIVTVIAGTPKILLSSLLVPAVGGGLAWRAAHSAAFPWLPTTSIMEWTIATITCTVISRVIYGLRAEVREARKFGQYVLERKIGEGAMGVVYRATHAMLRRPAAIKLLLKESANEADLARFEREVQLTSRLVHPNTISIFDYGRTAEGVFYYVMEYLDGLDLQSLVDRYGPVGAGARHPHPHAGQRGPRGGSRARPHPPRHQARQHRAHRAARRARRRQGGRLRSRRRGSVGNMAESAAVNAIVGTPLYMAPEAISQPDSVDGRSDLYAVGAVAYFLLTGRHVFEAATVIEICSKHMLETPIPPSERLGRLFLADSSRPSCSGASRRIATPAPNQPPRCEPPSSPAPTPRASTCRPPGRGGRPTAPRRRTAPDRPTSSRMSTRGLRRWRLILGGRSTVALNDVA